MKNYKSALLIDTIAFLLLGGCAIGPKYRTPSAPTPAAFKESPPDGWKEAQPADGKLRGNWWEMYGDSKLNALIEQVSISNQNVIAAEAQYRQAKAAVRVARSSLFPTASANVSATRSYAGTAGISSFTSGTRSAQNLLMDVSYEPDVWGSLRRGVTESTSAAQATAAQLANVRLLFQAELAQDYFQLHAIDTEQDLLKRTITSFEEYLKLTRDRFAVGVASDLDVAQAETQLYSAQSQSIDLNVQRSSLEHGIAILVGKPPADVTIPMTTLESPPPAVPVGVPSSLLERRPDISTAERNVEAANERIGIAKAAFFPVLTLGGTFGFQASNIANWISLPSRFWSVGPALAATLFDAGRRRGVVAEAQADYDTLAANYRQTVLTALQQVEDSLAALRYLEQEQATVRATVEAAERSLKLSTAQYRAGTASYLQVIVAQAATLQGQRTEVQLLGQRLVSSVQLIEALGGGWSTSQLPSPQEILAK